MLGVPWNVNINQAELRVGTMDRQLDLHDELVWKLSENILVFDDVDTEDVLVVDDGQLPFPPNVETFRQRICQS